ncbi:MULTISPECIES: M57 family metalloprotease [unclassified Corallococcus]|uniref:M57 family metalloprotease n=1 Tax=unclassified Corallococcus TaxID=2685029 RepID=UPI001A8DC579|nr:MULTISPECIES: M57 family metalloprotease [unclassified Corallococcus]MBN9682511.1 discoidin domain-containing protein [Corallococcus sp. NCSPR001]WAS85937.1 M57 family metalloprotease [Corallococcus sp. NCRR]
MKRTTPKRNAWVCHALRFTALLASAGCGAGVATEAPDEGPLSTQRLSFEEFERRTYREPETGIYIVDGDMPMSDLDELREYYDGLSKPGALIVRTVNGVTATWNSAQKLNLRYCVSTGFGSRYARVVEAMSRAANAWESAANVDFIHAQAEDSNCGASNPNVVFDVSPVSGQDYLARAFFPDDVRANRNVLIDASAFGSIPPYTLEGVLRHELGHTLGLRHEHTRPDSGVCHEDNNWRTLTSYDPDSVMHYPQCAGTNTVDLHLTQRDRIGIRALYGRGNLNLALMGNASASSTYCVGTSEHCYSPNRVNDASRDSTLNGLHGWTNANGAALPQWVQVDLGQPHVINQVNAVFSSGGVPQAYSIEVWNGSAWVAVNNVTGNTQVERIQTFEPVVASRVRLLGRLGSTTQPGYVRVNELEVYNNHENLALSAKASASSSFCALGCYSASKVNDGDFSTLIGGDTSWTNAWGAALPQWVELDFGGPRTFRHVELFMSEYGAPQTYSIQIWNGNAWEDLHEVQGNSQWWRSHYTLTPTTTSKLRVLGKLGSALQPGYVRINEVEIYEN